VISAKVAKLTTDAEKMQEQEAVQDNIKLKATEILERGNPIQYILDTYHKIHVGDEITGKATLAGIGSQSVKNSSGIQPKVSGKSGKGKSHAEKTILHLTPREYIIESSLSDMAVYHLDLKPGTIIFSDDTEVSEGLQGVIKRATTNYQIQTIHTISVKKEGGAWGAMQLTIPPRIMWVLTSVDDNGSIEFLNRQLNLGVDESQDQDKKVMEHHLRKAVTGEVEFSINDDVLVCREIIKDIKSRCLTVRIPYAERIIWNDPENRRNLPQFLDLIKSFAVFDHRHRVHTDENTIEANEIDFETALSLYSTRSINQKFKLNDNELGVLKKMVKGLPHDIKMIQTLTGLSYASVYRLFHGRDGKGGLLNKVPDLIYEPETDYMGETEIVGTDEFERERTITKVTKPRHVYVLNRDFNDISGFGSVASLREAKK
jgi:hypothetical protein